MNGRGVWRRLLGYAKPFQKSIWWALLLLILGTSAELAGPFVAKLAIDNHILSIQKRWYEYAALPQTGREPLSAVRVGNRYLVREDWLSGYDETLRQAGKPVQIVTEGASYYLVEGVFAGEGKPVLTPTGASADGRSRYEATLEQGGRTVRLEALLLTADDVKALYARDIWPLAGLMAGYAVLILASAGMNYVQLLSLQTTAQRIIQRMRLDLFAHLQRLPVSFFDKTPVGSLVSRVTNDTEAIRELYVSVLATFVQNGVYLLGILVALFVMQPALAAICCAVVPLLALLIYLYRRYSSRAYSLIRGRLGDMNAMINEMIQNMPVVQAFRRESGVQAEFAKLNREYFAGRMRENNLQALLLRPAVDLISTVTIALIVWYFGARSFHDVISFGVLYAFLDYMGRFFEPVNMIMQRLSHLQQAVTSAGRVFEVLDTPPLAEQGNAVLPRPSGRVVFDRVSFGYKPGEYVLKDVSFVAEPGQTVALVGHTGSGKSSLMNLLLGFYRANEGQITIDGVNIDDIEPKALRRHIGLVLQDPFLFTGDVAFNIRLYNQAISDDAVRDAAVAVRADQFIRQLPQGYAEPVVERGATLSAGQRQLLSFARALAADPAILILDEATASIDSETESAIQEALYALSRGRTTFMIAHRLSTIQHADLILVLSRGEVVERGTHDQLMSLGGLYQKMYLLQQGQLSANTG